MAATTDYALGVINPNELYTLRAFKQRLGITDHTLRSARRNGLQVRYLHKQGYVLGRDWIDYVLKSSRDHRINDPTPVSS